MNMDGFVTLAEFKETLQIEHDKEQRTTADEEQAKKKKQQEFKAMDSNDDGKVSQEEGMRLVRDNIVTGDQMRSLFSNSDSDKDGLLTVSEFFEGEAEKKKKTLQRFGEFWAVTMKDRFEAMDSSKDGKISKTEAQQYVKEHLTKEQTDASEWEKLFGAADSNGDNVVTLAEYTHAQEMDQLQQQMLAAAAKFDAWTAVTMGDVFKAMDGSKDG